MFSSLVVAGMICVFLAGIAVIVALATRAGAGGTGGTIARVLYDAENPEKTR